MDKIRTDTISIRRAATDLEALEESAYLYVLQSGKPLLLFLSVKTLC
jgi:hypothetical protein